MDRPLPKNSLLQRLPHALGRVGARMRGMR